MSKIQVEFFHEEDQLHDKAIAALILELIVDEYLGDGDSYEGIEVFHSDLQEL